jgi:general secretion pathway protein A
MYEAFYGLSEPPFRLTPDPHYLYLSTHHREALGHLLFGIREGTGFIAVTGDIGTGKTTLLRALLRDLEANTIVGYIFNPALSDLELLQTVNSEFSLPAASTSKKELVDELNRFLVAQKLAGKRVVIIVDEAQNLPPATLEQLRLLSNLETETTKLLQIVLVGQPELKQLLGRPELAQLNQRITLRWHLEPLDRAETARYIAHRLRIAGGPGTADIFSPGALRLIYRYSGGRPPSHQHRRAPRPACRLYARAAHHQSGARAPRHQGASHRRCRSTRPSPWSDPNGGSGGRSIGSGTRCRAVPVPAAGAVRSRCRVAATAGDRADGRPAGGRGCGRWCGNAGTRDGDRCTGAGADGARDTGPDRHCRTATSTPEAQPTPAPTAEPNAPPADGSPSAYQPSVTDGPLAFWAALEGVDAHGAAVKATSSLLAAWKVEALRADETNNPRLDLQAIAARRGLRYLPTSGTMARLSMLNMPAILELTLPTTGQRRFALLAGTAGPNSVVRFGEMGTMLTPQDVDRVWLGDAHLFWRDYENFSSRLFPARVAPRWSDCRSS